MKKLFTLFLVLVGLFVSANGEVKQSGTDFLVVQSTRTVQESSSLDVYRALVEEVSKWWDPAHTFSQSSGRLSIEAKPGGCFCETLIGGGGVQHLEVIYAEPGKTIRMSGGLGPLQGFAVSGVLTVTLSEADGEVTVDTEYRVFGHVESGLDQWAVAVDGVIAGQFDRLKKYVETGTAE